MSVHTTHTQHVITSAWPGVLHNTGSQHVNTVSGSSSPPHMPPCPVCYSQQQPAFCSGEIDIESWTPDTWLGAAGAWLVLTPSVFCNIKHIHALACLLDFADIFTDSRYFYCIYCFLQCCKGQQQQQMFIVVGEMACSANGIVSFKFVAINNHCPVSIISLHHIWSLLL